MKNSQLQSGGILTVEQARMMVQKKQVNAEAQARAVVAAADAKFKRATQTAFKEAEKVAMKKRLEGASNRAT